MSVTADLIDFAEHAGAQVRIWRGNGVGITWDCGRYWYHIWDKAGTHPQALYGETEYLEPRVPTMLSDYGEIMLRWAIVRIGERARRELGWPSINVPYALEDVHPGWEFQQLTPITGRLAVKGEYVPMEMRTIFPNHYELNILSHVMPIGFDVLLESYKEPAGGAAVAQWVQLPEA